MRDEPKESLRKRLEPLTFAPIVDNRGHGKDESFADIRQNRGIWAGGKVIIQTSEPVKLLFPLFSVRTLKDGY